jgi:hypothetical protein
LATRPGVSEELMIHVTLIELAGQARRRWFHRSESDDHHTALQEAVHACFGESWSIQTYPISGGLHGRVYQRGDLERRCKHLLRIEFD